MPITISEAVQIQNPLVRKITGDAWFQTECKLLSLGRKVLCVCVNLINPDLHRSLRFLNFENMSRYVICLSHLKLKQMALHCRYNKPFFVSAWHQRINLDVMFMPHVQIRVAPIPIPVSEMSPIPPKTLAPIRYHVIKIGIYLPVSSVSPDAVLLRRS